MRKLINAAGAVLLSVAVATPAPDTGPASTSAVPPVADSGPSVETKVGTVARLTGTASHPDGDAVEVKWLRSAYNGGSLASCSFSGATAFEPISAAGLAPTMSCTQPGDYFVQLVAVDGTSAVDSIGATVTFTPDHPHPRRRHRGLRGRLSDNDTGALVTFTPARDRSPAECLAVRLRSGAYVVRLQDPESGVVGFRAKPFVNVVLTPSGKSFPMPVAQTDIRVSRPTQWFRESAFIRHINGAGVDGTCFIAATADGKLRVHPWRDPLQVASR